MSIFKYDLLGSRPWLLRLLMKRCNISKMWFATVWYSLAKVESEWLCFGAWCSSTPIRRTFNAVSLSSFVLVVKCGRPKADWSALSNIFEQHCTGYRIDSSFRIRHAWRSLATPAIWIFLWQRISLVQHPFRAHCEGAALNCSKHCTLKIPYRVSHWFLCTSLSTLRGNKITLEVKHLGRTYYENLQQRDRIYLSSKKMEGRYHCVWYSLSNCVAEMVQKVWNFIFVRDSIFNSCHRKPTEFHIRL